MSKKEKNKVTFERADFPSLTEILEYRFRDMTELERKVAVGSAMAVMPSLYAEAGLGPNAFNIDRNREFPVPSKRFFLVCYFCEVNPMDVLGFKTSLPTLSERMGTIVNA